jgi:DNA-binding NarL/FixJ family response regulator
MMPYRVVIGDDNLAFIDSARRLLACDPDVVIVGHAQSSTAVLQQVALLHPDMLLLSVNLRGSGGLEFVRRIKTLADSLAVIVLALDDLDDYRTAASAAGADGFIAKADFAAQAIPLAHALFKLEAQGAAGDAYG